MAPNTIQQETATSSKVSEEPLNDAQLHLLHKLLKKSPRKEEVEERVLDNSTELNENTDQEKQRKEKEDLDLDIWFDMQSVKSHNVRYQQKDTKLQNDIFLYNFFLRRKSQDKADEYLRKIDSMKNEKIRSLVSKIRKVPIEYIPLSFEKLDPKESKHRETIRQQAIAEAEKSWISKSLPQKR